MPLCATLTCWRFHARYLAGSEDHYTQMDGIRADKSTPAHHAVDLWATDRPSAANGTYSAVLCVF